MPHPDKVLPENMAGLKVVPKYNLKQIKEMLVRGRLSGMVQRVEHDVLRY